MYKSNPPQPGKMDVGPLFQQVSRSPQPISVPGALDKFRLSGFRLIWKSISSDLCLLTHLEKHYLDLTNLEKHLLDLCFSTNLEKH